MSVYLLDLVYDEVALVAQHGGRVSVLFGQQIEPLGESVHHGKHNGPQEAQNIKDPLDGFSMACDESPDTRVSTHTSTSTSIPLGRFTGVMRLPAAQKPTRHLLFRFLLIFRVVKVLKHITVSIAYTHTTNTPTNKKADY